ncbi:MAG: hypothetical protein ABSG43_01105 [Solirubrobacteraceae bacterium]
MAARGELATDPAGATTAPAGGEQTVTSAPWRCRTLYRDEPREIARSAVSAHTAPIGSLLVLRHGQLGVDRLVALLWGGGRGVGPWEDHVLDLRTGEEITVSSEDPEWMARRATVAELPPAWLAEWPHRNGRPVTPGIDSSETGGGPDERWLRTRARRLCRTGAIDDGVHAQLTLNLDGVR